jgi:hypothetical protein
MVMARCYIGLLPVDGQRRDHCITEEAREVLASGLGLNRAG